MKRKKSGLFIVHGFLGDPKSSFYYLTQTLKKNWIKNFYATRIQAHGNGEDINDFDFRKALDKVEKEYVDYKSRFKKIYLIGFSMGGTIASHLASKYGADKLVLLAPAFRYGGTKKATKGLINFFKLDKIQEEDQTSTMIDFLSPKLNEDDLKKFAQEFADRKIDEVTGTKEDFLERLGNAKVSVFTNFTKLVFEVKKRFIEIDCPTRIYHSEDDQLVPTEASQFVFSQVNNKDKRLTLMDGAQHRIMSSQFRDDVTDEIIRFLYNRKWVRLPWTKNK